MRATQALKPGAGGRDARASDAGHYLLLWQQQGCCWVIQDDRRVELEPGAAVLLDERRPHDIRWGSESHDEIVLQIPCARLDAHVSCVSDLTMTAIDGNLPTGRLLGSMLRLLQRDRPHWSANSHLSLTEALISVIAAALRDLPDANVRKPSRLHGYYLECVRRYVSEHVRDANLTVRRIAQAVGLSSDHLARLFKGQPLSVSGLVRQLRMEGCGRELRDPRHGHRSIGDIAFAWGFNDVAHFSRAFKRARGMAPSDWRRGAQAHPAC